jgi:hypothetical protein
MILGKTSDVSPSLSTHTTPNSTQDIVNQSA